MSIKKDTKWHANPQENPQAIHKQSTSARVSTRNPQGGAQCEGVRGESRMVQAARAAPGARRYPNVGGVPLEGAYGIPHGKSKQTRRLDEPAAVPFQVSALPRADVSPSCLGNLQGGQTLPPASAARERCRRLHRTPHARRYRPLRLRSAPVMRYAGKRNPRAAQASTRVWVACGSRAWQAARLRAASAAFRARRLRRRMQGSPHLPTPRHTGKGRASATAPGGASARRAERVPDGHGKILKFLEYARGRQSARTRRKRR